MWFIRCVVLLKNTSEGTIHFYSIYAKIVEFKHMFVRENFFFSKKQSVLEKKLYELVWADSSFWWATWYFHSGHPSPWPHNTFGPQPRGFWMWTPCLMPKKQKANPTNWNRNMCLNVLFHLWQILSSTKNHSLAIPKVLPKPKMSAISENIVNFQWCNFHRPNSLWTQLDRI